MKKMISIIYIILLLSACKKDCDNPCIKNIEDEIEMDIHFNKVFCSGDSINFEWHYISYDEYQNTSCSPNVPIEIGFDGIILAQGVSVPFIGEDENVMPAYRQDVEILKDSCDKIINFHYTLTTIDTFDRYLNNRDVIVLLNGVDASYTVNFSHEIIPFGE